MPIPNPYPMVYRVDAAGKPAEWVGFFISDEAAREWTAKRKKDGAAFLIEHGDKRDLTVTAATKPKRVRRPKPEPVEKAEAK